VLAVQPNRAARRVGRVGTRHVVVVRARGERPLVTAVGRRPAVRTAVAIRAGGEILVLTLRAWPPLLLALRTLTVTWRLTVRRARPPLLLLVTRTLTLRARTLTLRARTLTLRTRALPRQAQLPSAGLLPRLASLPRELAALAVPGPGPARLVRVLWPATPSRAAVERRLTGTAMPCVARWFHCAPYRLAQGRCTAGEASPRSMAVISSVFPAFWNAASPNPGRHRMVNRKYGKRCNKVGPQKCERVQAIP
jgi:hypothetical protein